MKTLFFLVGSFLLLLCDLQAQHWQGIGNGLPTLGQARVLFADTVEDRLFVGGEFITQEPWPDYKSIGLVEWKNGKWDTLSTVPGGNWIGPVTQMQRYHDQYYITGFFSGMENLPDKGRAIMDADTLRSWPIDINEVPHFLSVFQGKLLLAHSGDTVNGKLSAHIGIIDTLNNWTDYAPPFYDNQPRVEQLLEFQGDIYAGGKLSNNTDTLSPSVDVHKLVQGEFKRAPGWQIGIQTYVADMIVYQNELVVVGNFFKNDGTSLGNGIVKFNGRDWTELGNGCDNVVDKLTIWRGNLIAAGRFYSCDGVHASRIARWDGHQWCSLGNDDFYDPIFDIEVFRDTLYVLTGKLLNGQNINRVARYVGGDFTHECGTFHPNQVEEISQNEADHIRLYPNPAEDRIHLQISGSVPVQLELINSRGQVEARWNVENRESDFDLSDVLPGLYIIRQVGEAKQYTERLLVH